MLNPKRVETPGARRHSYLNFGLVSLATTLEAAGYAPAVLHGLFADPGETLDAAISLGLPQSRLPLLLSIPSFYSVSWARRFCELVKERFPERRILAGGRWVVGDNSGWLRRNIPALDAVIYGTGEGVIVEALQEDRWNQIPECDLS